MPAKSLFAMPIRHMIWVATALLSVLPILCLARTFLLIYLQPELTKFNLIEISGILGFAVVSVIIGLILMLHIMTTLQRLALRSNELHDEASKFTGLESIFYEYPNPHPPDPFNKPIFSPSEYRNELARLDQTFNQVQTQLTRNLTRLREHSLLVHNLEVGIEHGDEMVMVLARDNKVLFSNRLARERLGVLAERDIRTSLMEGTLSARDSRRCARLFESWRGGRKDLSLNLGGSSGPAALRVTTIIDDFYEDELRKVIVIRDRSEYERLEKQLFRSEKLAALGQLISGVAHELNNPLAAILGFAELCQSNAKVDPETAGNLEIIEREARRTSRIVDNLLNFSRKRPSSKAFADIHKLLERCIALLAYNFRAHNVIVKRNYDTTVPDICIDEYQIQQVLMNIIINASQSMQNTDCGEPKIEISTRLDESEKHLLVEINDNGPGIPEDLLPRIFEPFFTTKSNDQGTGLGLPVSRKIIEAHNGRLQAFNHRDGGASFRIALPLLRPPPEKEALADSSPEERSQVRKTLAGRVLVIDDEPSIIAMTRHALEKVGLQVESATTISAALALLKRLSFDLLLVDVYMPDGSGEDIWEYVQKNQPRMTGRILFISGDTRVRRRLESRLGVDAHVLQKPFYMKDLREAVQSLVGTPEKVS